MFGDRCVTKDNRAEYYFRGESKNFKRQHEGPDLELDTDFSCLLDREVNWYENERDLYQEALRLNVVSFEKDIGMVERLARMQHFLMPTRFCDITSNLLVAVMFACGCGDLWNKNNRDNGHDGYVRILKIRNDKMKSFTSDIINAIAHLPLVNAERVHPSKVNGLDYLRYEITNDKPGFSMPDVQPAKSLEAEREKLCREIQQVWAFKPIWNTDRIRGQAGAFLAFGCRDGKKPLNPSFSPADYDNPDEPSCGIAQIDCIQINGNFKTRICEELRYFGLPVEGLYQDLTNVCSEIAERIKRKGRIT